MRPQRHLRERWALSFPALLSGGGRDLDSGRAGSAESDSPRPERARIGRDNALYLRLTRAGLPLPFRLGPTKLPSHIRPRQGWTFLPCFQGFEAVCAGITPF